MTRILADFPGHNSEWVDVRAAEQGKSLASVQREIFAWCRGWLGNER